jgi:uncharacterized membrane protein YphA (DoxX/SURF4 family)
MNRFATIHRTTAPAAVILIRLLVGGVFLSEGVQKLLYPAVVGAGRFARIGIPYPEVTGPFVGGVEIVCGLLLLAGFLTRPAAVVLLANMAVAITATTVTVLLGRAVGPFAMQKLPYYGVWGFLHEARTDLSMIFCLLFLLIVGAGRWSMDARLGGRVAAAGR